ncbi:MBL fold metallo-hydrolase [Mycolicibacterium sp. P1-18]|uniref:MBL fold metallo-hydrolase n=1 Tax=Mycolicibacterium sp. P1-18 TaxID=2024615 RepID=UPI0011F324D7|nr:MBL fold metallo-hydrolase [Mycolicibacterium sp. P1-18]KAA0098759.1 MBL fold metallo-hydrolase [Mycolicibacterium sp. P1-18]
MNDIVLGDVSVTRVMEYFGSVELSPATFFPDSRPESWDSEENWLVPDFYDPGSGMVVAALQTWVLRSAGATILVDTGAGNSKPRPGTRWDHLDTDFLANLARAGVRPEDVDVVVNTHLHNDHVGWNTILCDGQWVPTFPNARYLMPRADFDFWNPANGHRSRGGPASHVVFEDSVAPVHQAGLVDLWDTHLDVDENLRLELAPGHTPGSSLLTLQSGTDRAVFVGDLLHTALQFGEPDANSCFCEDPAEARATRRRVLGQAADTHTLVFPAHLGGHGAAEVRHRGDGFAVTRWADFARATRG